jgi:Uncharacterized protein conserved in bacteria
MYVLQIVLFLRLPNEEEQKIHRTYLKKMAEKGKLKLAGRMSDDSGSFLLWEVDTLDEARNIAMEEPYYKLGISTFILKEWKIIWNYFVHPPKSPI